VKPDPDNVRVQTIKEEASEGVDVFISAEDPVNDVLLGHLRLRIPSRRAHRPEITPETTTVLRELHIYGPMLPVGMRAPKAWQHRGYGGLLLSEAERMSQEDYGRRKVVIISGLGAKQYYKRLGYDYDGPYVSKTL